MHLLPRLLGLLSGTTIFGICSSVFPHTMTRGNLLTHFQKDYSIIQEPYNLKKNKGIYITCPLGILSEEKRISRTLLSLPGFHMIFLSLDPFHPYPKSI